jgi:hypothetical protein
MVWVGPVGRARCFIGVGPTPPKAPGRGAYRALARTVSPARKSAPSEQWCGRELCQLSHFSTFYDEVVAKRCL